MQLCHGKIIVDCGDLTAPEGWIWQSLCQESDLVLADRLRFKGG